MWVVMGLVCPCRAPVHTPWAVGHTALLSHTTEVQQEPCWLQEGLLPSSGLSGAACSTSPWIYGGLEGGGSIPANRVWAAVRGLCVLGGDPGHEKDKAGAEVVGTHLFG